MCSSDLNNNAWLKLQHRASSIQNIQPATLTSFLFPPPSFHYLLPLPSSLLPLPPSSSLLPAHGSVSSLSSHHAFCSFSTPGSSPNAAASWGHFSGQQTGHTDRHVKIRHPELMSHIHFHHSKVHASFRKEYKVDVDDSVCNCSYKWLNLDTTPDGVLYTTQSSTQTTDNSFLSVKERSACWLNLQIVLSFLC